MGGLMTTIINRNASIPVKQSEVFSTGADFQESVEIHVLQGERPFAKDNKSLGIFRLKGIPSAPRGVPKINVTFQLDVNGLLSVSAREEQSGQEQSIKIEGASVLAREEVSEMIKAAEENAMLDKTKKSLVNITYELDNLFLKSENLIENLVPSNSSSALYFTEVLNEIKECFKLNKFNSISEISLSKLKYSYNVLVLEYLKKELSTKTTSKYKSNSDNIIDVELADENEKK
jgi:molecular chaperone DnaK